MPLLALFLRSLTLSTPATAFIPYSSVSVNVNVYVNYRHSAFQCPLELKSQQKSRLKQSNPNNEADTIDSNSGGHDDDKDDDREVGNLNRRQMFGDILRVATCGCTLGTYSSPHAAHALAQIVTPNQDATTLYDLSRNPLTDAAFAQGMATGMVDYEREAFPKKKALFSQLFRSLEAKDEPVVVEVGMGSFPNALYYPKAGKGLDIVGIDPNDRMEGYAKDSARRAGIVPMDSLRILHGVSEALPFGDSTVDAVVCTLTMCSVVDPEKSIAEIRRVLKPGGKFLFWEHVLSEQDDALMKAQIAMSPQQVKRADGCHLDRRTGKTIEAAGFAKLDMEYLELKNFYFLNPTVCGIATA